MKKQKLQELIKEKETSSPKISLNENLKRLIANEGILTVKKINYYIKDLKKSIEVYKSLEKKLPEVEVNILAEEPLIKVKHKNKTNQVTITKIESKTISNHTFLLNTKSKNKTPIEEMIVDISGLLSSSDSKMGMHDLFSMNLDEYKEWLQG